MEKPIKAKDLIEWIHKAVDHSKIQNENKNSHLALEQCLAKLTTREKEVYSLVIRGKTNKMIASELNIKLGTVEFHRANMMGKMGATTFPDLMELSHAANPLLNK